MQIIEKYRIKTEDINIDVGIEGEEERALMYKIFTPKIAAATLALLTDIRKKLITETVMSVAEMLDARAIEKTKERFKEKASLLLDEKVKLEKETKDILIALLMNEMLGLGDIEFLLNEPALEEIVITS